MEQQREYVSLRDNSATVVHIRKKKYKLRWAKNGQISRLSKLLLNGKTADETPTTEEVFRDIKESSKLSCKAAAIYILDGYWKCKFRYWYLWRWFYYIRQYDDMDLQEDFVKYLLNWALTKCRADLEFFDKRIQPGLIAQLEHVVNSKFERITYTDAIKELEKHADKFEFKPYWGCDIATEHERYLTEQIFKKPVMVYNYPKEIKSFYMKQNDDGKTVKACDVLVPGIGELNGGSEREEDYDKLLAEIKRRGMDESIYDWYLKLRKFGTVPHSGFGMGFERLIRYVTGMENIRDVIPYPRAPKLADF